MRFKKLKAFYASVLAASFATDQCVATNGLRVNRDHQQRKAEETDGHRVLWGTETIDGATIAFNPEPVAGTNGKYFESGDDLINDRAVWYKDEQDSGSMMIFYCLNSDKWVLTSTQSKNVLIDTHGGNCDGFADTTSGSTVGTEWYDYDWGSHATIEVYRSMVGVPQVWVPPSASDIECNDDPPRDDMVLIKSHFPTEQSDTSSDGDASRAINGDTDTNGIFHVMIYGGTNQGETFLSTTTDGNVELFSVDDNSGRQKWVFSAIPNTSPTQYNIKVFGGTNPGEMYLSWNTAGGFVNLYRVDDGSLRQRWILENHGSYYNIKVAGGTNSGETYLHVTAAGDVDLHSNDDGSGRQRWQIVNLSTTATTATTEGGSDPWWYVDVGAGWGGPVVVSKVTVWNRADCCSDRLYGAILELLDSSGSVLASRLIDSSIGTGSLTFDFNHICDVQKIQVRIPGDDKVLSLTEVKAWGYAPRQCGDQCALVWGDPHFITFDKMKYDCHGIGEFAMLMTTCAQNPIAIHGRFVELHNWKVAVIRSVVVKVGNLPVIHVQVPDIEAGGSDPCPYSFTMTTNEDPVSVADIQAAFGSDALFSTSQGLYNTEKISMKFEEFDVGVEISTKPHAGGCYINTGVCLNPCNFDVDCEIVGLMGSPNGYQEDDWMSGIVKDISLGAEIYQFPPDDYYERAKQGTAYCVNNWCVDDPSKSFYSSSTWSTYDNCTVVPDPPNPDPFTKIKKLCDGVIIEDIGPDVLLDVALLNPDATECPVENITIYNKTKPEPPEPGFFDNTPGPSHGPTPGPTPQPSAGPTQAPTPGPSHGPTPGPTPQPSAGPTQAPTPGPTPQPSAGPTQAPTPQPSAGPTQAPTPYPTPPVTSVTPPPKDPPLDTPPGSKGDPHFKTWKQEHFEYHGQCDLVLTKDPTFANGLGLEVQIRTKLIRFWSYIKSAAIYIGDDILEVQGNADPEETENIYWINFEYQKELKTIGGFPVTVRDYDTIKRVFEIHLDSMYPGQKIVIAYFKEFVKVSFENATEEAYGNTVGLLGDYKTGKTLARDGVAVLDDFYEFGKEWQVLPSEVMLFHDVEQPQFPQRCIEPEDPQGDRRRRLEESSVSEADAEKACASIADPLDRKDCIYDVMATQDLDMVGAY